MIFERNFLALATASIVALWVGLSVVPVEAGPYLTGTSAFGAARSLTREMSSQARSMAKLIAKIDIEFVEDVQEKIREARDLIVTCPGSCAVEQHQASIIINQVLSHLDDFIELKFDLFLTNIEQLAEDAGSLEGKVDSLVANGKVQSSAGDSIQDKIDAIDALLNSLRFEVEAALSLIEDGDEDEGDACDQTLTGSADDDCDDIEDWLEIFLDDPSDIDPLNAALDILELILGFGTTDGDLDTALKKITKSCPVGILPCLVAIDKILRAEQRRNAYKPTNTPLTNSESLSVFIAENSVRFQLAPNVSHGTLKLWAADGRLIGVYALTEKSLTLPFSLANLKGSANGVYYYAATLKNADGRVAKTTVRKLVLVR